MNNSQLVEKMDLNLSLALTSTNISSETMWNMNETELVIRVLKNISTNLGVNTSSNITSDQIYSNSTLNSSESFYSNMSDVVTDELFDSAAGETLTFKIIKLSLYTVIFLISVIGNSLVCWCVNKRRKLRNVTNTFIFNLAVSDLAVTCICIPFDIPVQEMNYIWPYGAFVCKILWPLQTITTFSSVFTLACLAITRYWAVVHPLKRQLTIKKAKICIVAVWIMSSMCLIPYVMVLNLNEETMECGESWPQVKYRKAYTMFLFVAQYLIPISVITLVYTRIAYELYCSQLATTNSALKETQVNEARKVVKMLVIVTFLFAVCVLPNNVAWIWLDFGNAEEEFANFWDYVAICNIILFANCAANPVCYTMCNESFRKEFGTYFMICLTKSKIHDFRKNIVQRRKSVSTVFTTIRRDSSFGGLPTNWRLLSRLNSHTGENAEDSKERIQQAIAKAAAQTEAAYCLKAEQSGEEDSSERTVERENKHDSVIESQKNAVKFLDVDVLTTESMETENCIGTIV